MHTHARRIVQNFIHQQLSLIHAARRELFCVAVTALMSGHLLSLSRLARALIAQGTHKAALKRVERLIGSPRIAQEAQIVGAQLLRTLCRGGQPLVIAVDWSAVAPDGAFVELRAVVTRAGMGRGLTIYQQVYPEAKLGNAGAERTLLKTLRPWIPAHAQVVFVTDAGFRRPWFIQVEHQGWLWIGRIRSGAQVSRDKTHWEQVTDWFAKATGKACRWSGCWLTSRYRYGCDMVLVRQRLTRGKRYGRAGHGSTPKAQREAHASAHEPWLLAHSPKLGDYRADEIVALFKLRMQIEENFRDGKSISLGMGLEVSQSRLAPRLHALLLIATLAAFLLWHIGQLAEAEGLHLRFKATNRTARELSVITLARLLCSQMQPLPLTNTAIQILRDRLGIRI